ncbi:hypothetical protein GOODEAATRI_021696 [Goodea atripinnis]|uniref:Uncharacterized protein n=1 Tax=Goodea atripinnis TaxID=208336 RepID=A0ABV0N3C0_9TELE
MRLKKGCNGQRQEGDGGLSAGAGEDQDEGGRHWEAEDDGVLIHPQKLSSYNRDPCHLRAPRKSAEPPVCTACGKSTNEAGHFVHRTKVFCESTSDGVSLLDWIKANGPRVTRWRWNMQQEVMEAGVPALTRKKEHLRQVPQEVDQRDETQQAIRDEVGKLKDGFVSDLLKSGSFHCLRSSSMPRDNLEAASSYLTPDSNSSSPTNFHGRRSAVRRHSHCGVVSPNQSPNSSFAEPCFDERAASLSSSRRLEYKTPEICIEDPSPTPPPSIKLTSCTLWQDLEEVKASGLLNIVTPKEISLQEVRGLKY